MNTIIDVIARTDWRDWLDASLGCAGVCIIGAGLVWIAGALA